MALLVVALGAVVVSLPAAARGIGRRLKPAEWSLLSAAAVVGGTLIAQGGLAMLAAPTVLRALGVEAIADACDRAIAPLTPFGDAGGWVALGLLGLSAAAGGHGFWGARRQGSAAWIDPSIGERWRTAAGIEVVTVPTPRPLAYSVTLPQRQIVLSEGLIVRCDRNELDLIIEHEQAHIRYGHHQLLAWTAAATSVMRWWPGAAASQRELGAALERWADESAVAGHSDRRQRLRELLERIATAPADGAVAAFSSVETIARRIEALAAPPPDERLVHRLVYLPGIAASGAALSVAAIWIGQARLVWTLAGACPFAV